MHLVWLANLQLPIYPPLIELYSLRNLFSSATSTGFLCETERIIDLSCLSSGVAWLQNCLCPSDTLALDSVDSGYLTRRFADFDIWILVLGECFLPIIGDGLLIPLFHAGSPELPPPPSVPLTKLNP